MRKDCNYRFCDKTRFVQHTARHERLDTLCGEEFEGFRGVPCGRPNCELNAIHARSKFIKWIIAGLVQRANFLKSTTFRGLLFLMRVCCNYSSSGRGCSKVQQPFSLPEMWLLLHRHQQGSGPSQATPEAWFHHGCRLWKVHPNPILSCGWMPPQWKTNPLPLFQMSICSAWLEPNGRT